MVRTPDLLILPSDRDASGRDLGEAELALLTEAVRSGHLNSTGGTLVPRFEAGFATRFERDHAIACASGSAGVHAAIASLGLEAGDEVVTTPITDIGAIMPICYERAVPVFADVEVETANVSARTIEPCLSTRTRAIVVTHLFGMPCDMEPIVELARAHDVALIEDCAQAFLAEDRGRLVGTFGDLACFSFQQGKHMTTGEGGIVTTSDANLADAVTRFVNKGWGYGDADPDHDRPGLNYRMTELQAAVGIAQLAKLDSIVARREARAAELTDRLGVIDGISPPRAPAGGRHAYWRYALRIDSALGEPEAIARELGRRGVASAPRYIRKPAYECRVFRDARRAPVASGFAIPAAQDRPGVIEALARLLVLPWNEHYTHEHCAALADAIEDACEVA